MSGKYKRKVARPRRRLMGSFDNINQRIKDRDQSISQEHVDAIEDGLHSMSAKYKYRSDFLTWLNHQPAWMQHLFHGDSITPSMLLSASENDLARIGCLELLDWMNGADVGLRKPRCPACANGKTAFQNIAASSTASSTV